MAEKELVEQLIASGLFIATAESLTGGLLGSAITSVAGSSSTYLGGVIAYQNQIKEQVLGVSPTLIANQGAVDAEVAAQLASGVRDKFAKSCQKPIEKVIGIATTGVAGPGEAEGKPAGTVFIGISSVAGESVYAHSFSGSRAEVREQSVASALAALREQLQLICGY